MSDVHKPAPTLGNGQSVLFQPTENDQTENPRPISQKGSFRLEPGPSLSLMHNGLSLVSDHSYLMQSRLSLVQ